MRRLCSVRLRLDLDDLQTASNSCLTAVADGAKRKLVHDDGADCSNAVNLRFDITDIEIELKITALRHDRCIEIELRYLLGGLSQKLATRIQFKSMWARQSI